jgi:hypothetical protein
MFLSVMFFSLSYLLCCFYDNNQDKSNKKHPSAKTPFAQANSSAAAAHLSHLCGAVPTPHSQQLFTSNGHAVDAQGGGVYAVAQD